MIVPVVLAAADATLDVVARLVEDLANGLKSVVVEVENIVYCRQTLLSSISYGPSEMRPARNNGFIKGLEQPCTRHEHTDRSGLG